MKKIDLNKPVLRTLKEDYPEHEKKIIAEAYAGQVLLALKVNELIDELEKLKKKRGIDE